jgi:glycosyltransferase involved in cell wall biosynthesis
MMRELAGRHSFTLVTNQVDQRGRIPELETMGIRVVLVPPGAGGEEGGRLRGNYRLRALTRTLFGEPEELRMRGDFGNRVRGVIGDELARGCDVLEVGHTWCARWIEGMRIAVPRVLVLHNVVSQLYRRMYGQGRARLERLEAYCAWKRMVRYERRTVRMFDRCVVMSEAEREILRALAPGCEGVVVPNGVDTAYFPPLAVSPEPCSLVFTAGMSYLPNRDAMRWFCADILPRIRERFPGVKLSIVGPDPSPSIIALHDGERILVDGETADARPHIAAAAVYVVPIRLGAGTRVKILESLAMGKAVVSTRVGCEGLGLVHGEHILIADREDEFAGCVCRLLADVDFAARLGRAGMELVRRKFDYRILAPMMDAVYEDALRGSTPRG